MKKLLLILSLVLPVHIACGQVVMTIDSVDISRTDEKIRIRWHPVSDYDDPVTPRVKIVATVVNHTPDTVFIYFPQYREDMNVGMLFEGKTFYQNLAWKNPQAYYMPGGISPHTFGLKLFPEESGSIELWTYAHVRLDMLDIHDPRRYWHPFPTYPEEWDWGKGLRDLTDEDYLAWFKVMLNSMRVFVTYGDGFFARPRMDKKLVSEQIGFQKLVVTSNLTDEELIDEHWYEMFRSLDLYLKYGRTTEALFKTR